MTKSTVQVIKSYFSSLQVYNKRRLMTKEQKITFKENLKNLWGCKVITRAELIYILTWLDSIKMGDGPNNSAYYYFNFDETCIHELFKILNSCICCECEDTYIKSNYTPHPFKEINNG